MNKTTALPNQRLFRTIAVALFACLLTMSVAPHGAALSNEANRVVSVVVQGLTGSSDAREAVEQVGGTVTRDLSLVGGVGAEVPAGMLDLLRNKPSVYQVTPNTRVGFDSHNWGGTQNRVQKVVKANKLWDEGITGEGVTVALLDTGVYAAHPDLQGPNGSRVVHCEDFTTENGTEAECADTFGHGTFMAGLIAGNGASSNGVHMGSAPEAEIVAIKAAGYDGSTDVTTILAGMQWAVAHKDQYGIRVLNLSLGTDSAQDYRLSPMNLAVEKAWDAGIAVVVSAGNSGPDSATILKPGDDPFVITVGASNDHGSTGIGDDRVPSFSSRGPTRANGIQKPDVVSPGVHTVSLRSPGSAIDNNYGSTARVGSQYFKGSGTSMSTATVSGVIAQILDHNPLLNPNQVKNRLTSTARDILDDDPNAAGAGLIDAYSAAKSLSLLEANQGIDRSTGLGSLALDRGGLDIEVVTPVGQLALIGEFKAQLNPEYVSPTNPGGLVPWVSLDYASTGWDATTWRATTWRVDEWSATTWRATTWRGTEWDATTWRGTIWEDANWDATTWRDVDWDATTWRATTWRAAWYAVAWD